MLVPGCLGVTAKPSFPQLRIGPADGLHGDGSHRLDNNTGPLRWIRCLRIPWFLWNRRPALLDQKSEHFLRRLFQEIIKSKPRHPIRFPQLRQFQHVLPFRMLLSLVETRPSPQKNIAPGSPINDDREPSQPEAWPVSCTPSLFSRFPQ